MAGKVDAIRSELASLVEWGRRLYEALSQNKDTTTFRSEYQQWYSKALPVVRQLLPDRLAEFQGFYRLANRKAITYATYTLEDYMIAVQIKTGVLPAFDIDNAAANKFVNQVLILQSAESRLTGALADIRGVLQADLFDSELGAARELAKNGHLRAAGAVAGVVLEGHLAEMCSNHGITVSKKEPTIGDYNDLLKQNEVLDVPQWRLVQWLADLRNLCTHKKSREPTADEVLELIGGVDKAVKTLS
jgi:hypothetical protein